MTFQQPYRIGDVVRINNDSHIIAECSLDAYPVLQYATNKGAWYKHEECTLIVECCAESLQQLAEELFDEGADYEDDV